jgi:putative transposase
MSKAKLRRTRASWSPSFARSVASVTPRASEAAAVGVTTRPRRTNGPSTYFPNAEHQRCTVHYLRNVRSLVSSRERQAMVTAALKDAWAAPTRAEAEARLQRLLAEIRSELPRLADWLEQTFADTLAFYTLPVGEARRRLKTTNGVEHDHAEVRRRSSVIRIFPNEAALIRLLGALAMERNEQWLERRYLTITKESNTDELAQVA